MNGRPRNPQRYEHEGRTKYFGTNASKWELDLRVEYRIVEPLTGEQLDAGAFDVGPHRVKYTKLYERFRDKKIETRLDASGRPHSYDAGRYRYKAASSGDSYGYDEANAYNTAFEEAFGEVVERLANVVDAGKLDSLDRFREELRERKRY